MARDWAARGARLLTAAVDTTLLRQGVADAWAATGGAPVPGGAPIAGQDGA